MATSKTESLTGALAFLAAVRLVVNTAQRFVYPFLPAISRGLGVSLDTAGVLVSARWGAGLATPLLVAALGRTQARRWLIGFGLAVFAVGAAVTAASTVFVGALVGFVLMGLAKPVFDISVQSYLSDRVPYSLRARYLALMELTWAGGLLVGAPLAGFLIDRAGWRAPFWVITGLVAVALVLQVRILEAVAAGPPATSTPMRWDRSALGLLAVIALFSSATEIVFVAFGAWLESEFALTLVALGGTAVLVGIVELSAEGSAAAFTDRIGKRNAVGVGVLVAATGFGLLAVFDDHYVLGMISMLVGFAGFEFSIVSSIPLATGVHPTDRVKYLSWIVVAMSVGRGLGALAAAPVFTAAGMSMNALVAAFANIVAFAILVAWVRESAEQRAASGQFPGEDGR